VYRIYKCQTLPSSSTNDVRYKKGGEEVVWLGETETPAGHC